MNFISMVGDKGVEVELKYCECCGGLWLRPQGGDEVYCRGCRSRMEQLPRAAIRRAIQPRLPQGNDLKGGFEVESLQGVAEMEVRV